VLCALAIAWAGLRPSPVVARAEPTIRGVRRLHSGHPGDYVAWVAAGAAVLMAVFAATLR
jgi:multicomponent Na+:H+ antiporter subunit D